MAKRKYQEEMSDERSLKAVEDKKVENGRRDETSNEELLKAVKRIKSPLFEFEFQTVGPLKCWKKNVVARQPFAAPLKEFCQPSQDDYDGAEIIWLIMFQLPKLLCQSLSLLLPRRH